MSEHDRIQAELDELTESLAGLTTRTRAARTDLASLRRYELERGKAWRSVRRRAVVIALLTLGAGAIAYNVVKGRLAEAAWRESRTTITWAGTTRSAPQRNCQLQAVVSGDGGDRFIARRLSVRCDGGEEVIDPSPRCEHLRAEQQLELGCFMNAPIVVDTKSKLAGFVNHGQWHWLEIEPDSGASANPHVVRGPAFGYAAPTQLDARPRVAPHAIYDPTAEDDGHAGAHGAGD